MSSPASTIPMLDATVELAAGTYRLGEADAERDAPLVGVRIGRWPVVNASMARFVQATGREVSPALARKLVDPLLAEHPATDVAYEDATAFCAWAGGRLPSGDEWEAAARGTDGRAWPWGETFDPERCACVESGWGWTAPVTAHPAGASTCGAEQLAGNVWEWVRDRTEDGAWRAVRGGSYLDHAWGVRAARVLAADPSRATPTTGFRLVIDPRESPVTQDPASITAALREVYDPCCADRGISIVDMGVVEDVRVSGGHVDVDLVLTTGWCPFVATMSSSIPDRLRELDGVETVDVRVVWDPVWTPERLSPSARDALSMPLEQLEPYRERRLASVTPQTGA